MLRYLAIPGLALALIAAAPLPKAMPLEPPAPGIGPQTQSHQQPTKNDDQGSASDERGTEKSPLVVKTESLPKTQAEADNDADFRERKTTDGRLVSMGFIEIAIGIGTGLIFILQTAALLLTLRSSNRAIALSEKHFTETQRPYVAVELVRPLNSLDITEFERGFEFEDDAGRSIPFQITYDLVNYGKNPAIVKEHYMAIYIGEDLPKSPAPNPNDIFTNEFVLGSIGRRSGFRNAFYRGIITKELCMAITFSQAIADSGVKPTKVYAFGMVRYESIGGKSETIGSIWEYLAGENRFIEVEVANYSYRI